MTSDEEIVFKLWTYCKKACEKPSKIYYFFSSFVAIWANLTDGIIYYSEIYGKSWENNNCKVVDVLVQKKYQK